jgi:hypothetical protein
MRERLKGVLKGKGDGERQGVVGVLDAEGPNGGKGMPYMDVGLRRLGKEEEPIDTYLCLSLAPLIFEL